jgi:hypothetical protein
MWEKITSGGGEVIKQMGDTLSKIDVHGFDLIILYIKLYGIQTIFHLLM